MKNDTARLLRKSNPFLGDEKNERRGYRAAKRHYNKANRHEKTQLRAAMVEMIAAQKISESMTKETD